MQVSSVYSTFSSQPVSSVKQWHPIALTNHTEPKGLQLNTDKCSISKPRFVKRPNTSLRGVLENGNPSCLSNALQYKNGSYAVTPSKLKDIVINGVDYAVLKSGRTDDFLLVDKSNPQRMYCLHDIVFSEDSKSAVAVGDMGYVLMSESVKYKGSCMGSMFFPDGTSVKYCALSPDSEQALELHGFGKKDALTVNRDFAYVVEGNTDGDSILEGFDLDFDFDFDMDFDFDFDMESVDMLWFGLNGIEGLVPGCVFENVGFFDFGMFKSFNDFEVLFDKLGIPMSLDSLIYLFNQGVKYQTESVLLDSVCPLNGFTHNDFSEMLLKDAISLPLQNADIQNGIEEVKCFQTASFEEYIKSKMVDRHFVSEMKLLFGKHKELVLNNQVVSSMRKDTLNSIRLTQHSNGLYIKPIGTAVNNLVYYCLEKQGHIPMTPWTVVDARMAKLFDKIVLGVFSDKTSLHIYIQNYYIKCNISKSVEKYNEELRFTILKKNILQHNHLVDYLKRVTPTPSKNLFENIKTMGELEELSEALLISDIDTVSEFGSPSNNRAALLKYTNPNEVLNLIDEYMVSGNSDILSDMAYMAVACKYAVLSYLKNYLNINGKTIRFFVLVNLICTQSEIDYLLDGVDLDEEDA